MGNNAPKPTVQSLILAVVTILIILVVNIYTTGFIKSISILIGLIAGTIIAATMGLVDFSPVAEAPLVHIPTPFYFGAPQFEISSIVMMCIIATVSMVESTGVYLALSDITKDPIDSTRLRNGYRAEGLAVYLVDFQYLPLYRIFTKRRFGETFRYSYPFTDLLRWWFPHLTWSLA